MRILKTVYMRQKRST